MSIDLPYSKFAEVYDQLMSQQQFYNSYYSFILKILHVLKAPKPERILEVACGTGKLAGIFIDKGYQVEGLDSSESMLKIARKRGIAVYRRDMTNFKLWKKYDLALCVFDSLNYIRTRSGLQGCFASVHRHLNPGRLFIFDLNSRFKINKATDIFNEPVHYLIGNTELIWINSHKPETWIADIVMVERSKDGKLRRFHERHIEKAYKLDDMKRLLKKTGFRILGVYSNFNFGSVSKDSERWFFVCRKG